MDEIERTKMTSDIVARWKLDMTAVAMLHGPEDPQYTEYIEGLRKHGKMVDAMAERVPEIVDLFLKNRDYEKDAEIERLTESLATSKALEVRFFPQESAHKTANRLRAAGMGDGSHKHGNTLLGMAENCLDEIAALKEENAKLKEYSVIDHKTIHTQRERIKEWKGQIL